MLSQPSTSRLKKLKRNLTREQLQHEPKEWKGINGPGCPASSERAVVGKEVKMAHITGGCVNNL
jgi:hypothetical protein